MNTVDDLRSTLEHHSHDAAGLDPLSRRNQVGERITTARRRRNAVRGGVAAAAVVAVAAAVLVPTLGGDDVELQPADRTVVGVEAPATIDTPDHTYRFAESWAEEGAGQLEVDLDFSAEARILSWATAGDDQGVRVKGPYDASWDSTRGDFEDWVAIPDGFEGTVTVATNNPGAEGLGAALYEADLSALPDVVEGFHGQYFRAEGPVSRRIAVGVGERGETELTLPYADAGTHVAIEISCDGLPAGLWVHASVGGAQTSRESDTCQGDSGDEESSTILTKDLGLQPGGYASRAAGADWPDGEARVWVTRTSKDDTSVDPSAFPDAQLAAAVYVPQEDPVEVEGVSVPLLTWHNGHLWGLVRTTPDVTGPTAVTGLPAGTPGLVTVITQAGSQDVMVTATTLADGKQLDRVNVGIAAGGATSGPLVLPLGTREVEVRVAPMRGEEPQGDLDVRQHLALHELLE